MAEEKVLKRNVLVTDAQGKRHKLEAGSVVPPELAELVRNPKVYVSPERETFDDPDVPAALKQGISEPPRGSELKPPPMHGKGSSREAWAAYLKKVLPDAEIGEEDSREDLIEFLKSEGKPV